MPIWSTALEGQDPLWPDLLTMAQLAEDAGFDSIWVGDTLLLFDLPIGLFECWSVIAATAQATTSIRLGSLVSSNTFRNPALTAKIAQTVDGISGGRLTLGLGAGGALRQHAAYGMPETNRFSRLEEALPVVRKLLRGETVTHRGNFYSLDECVLLPRTSTQNRIPILVAGVSQRILELAAGHADAWNAWLAYSSSTASALEPHISALKAACERMGRPVDDLEITAGVGVALPGSTLRIGDLDFTPGAIVGDVESIGERLSEFEEIGVGLVQLTFAPATLESLEQLADLNKWFHGPDG